MNIRIKKMNLPKKICMICGPALGSTLGESVTNAADDLSRFDDEVGRSLSDLVDVLLDNGIWRKRCRKSVT
jgi:hypothetical protein